MCISTFASSGFQVGYIYKSPYRDNSKAQWCWLVGTSAWAKALPINFLRINKSGCSEHHIDHLLGRRVHGRDAMAHDCLSALGSNISSWKGGSYVFYCFSASFADSNQVWRHPGVKTALKWSIFAIFTPKAAPVAPGFASNASKLTIEFHK